MKYGITCITSGMLICYFFAGKLAGDTFDEMVDAVIEHEVDQELAANQVYQQTYSSVLDPIIHDTIHEELDKQTEEVGQKRAYRKKLGKHIDKKIKKEVNRQYYNELRSEAKEKLERRVGINDISTPDYVDFIYKIPAWPFSAIFYAEKDLFETDLTYQSAGRMFSSGGHTRDLSELIFGSRPMYVKDILLVSKLLSEGKLDANGATDVNNIPSTDAHYLTILADQELAFDADFNRWELSLNYARHFVKDQISFGFQIPIVRLQHKIKLTSSISPQKRQELEDVGSDSVKFSESYVTLDDFLEDVLNKKNISYNRSDHEFGIGDITTFLNFEINYPYAERLVAGVDVVFPTAKSTRNIHKLWDPELGNGGFIEISGFSGFLWGEHQLFNPHVFVRGTYSFPADLNRRVPKKKVYDGAIPAPPGEKVDAFLVFGEEASFNDEMWDDIDTTYRHFSSESTTIRVRKGPQIFLRIGNIFDRIFYKKGSLDLFYDIRLKARDYVGRRQSHQDYKKTILNQNTFQTEHRGGANFIYHFSGSKRLQAGVLVTLAGKNVPRVFQANLSFDFEF